MMKWLVKWGVKRWLVGVVNTALADYESSVAVARHHVSVAIARIESVLKFLRSLDTKLADNKLTDGEMDAIIDEAGTLATALVSTYNPYQED